MTDYQRDQAPLAMAAADEIERLRAYLPPCPDHEIAKIQLDGAVERGLKMFEAKNYWRDMYTDLLKRVNARVSQDPGHAELIARLYGRALFLRNRGGVKSPDLMERAARALASPDTRPDRASKEG